VSTFLPVRTVNCVETLKAAYSCNTHSTCGWVVCGGCYTALSDPTELVSQAKLLQDKLVVVAHHRLTAANAISTSNAPNWTGPDPADASWKQSLPAQRLQCERFVLKDKDAIGAALEASIDGLVQHQQEVLRAVWATEVDASNKLSIRLRVVDRFMHRLNLAVEQYAKVVPASVPATPASSPAVGAGAGAGVGRSASSLPAPASAPSNSTMPTPASTLTSTQPQPPQRTPELDAKTRTIEFFLRTGIISLARCPLFDRKLHSRMPLSFTPLLRLKLLHACDQWHSSRVSTFLTGSHCKSRPITEGSIPLASMGGCSRSVGTVLFPL
jgi:hypothetical protein